MMRSDSISRRYSPSLYDALFVGNGTRVYNEPCSFLTVLSQYSPSISPFLTGLGPLWLHRRTSELNLCRTSFPNIRVLKESTSGSLFVLSEYLLLKLKLEITSVTSVSHGTLVEQFLLPENFRAR